MMIKKCISCSFYTLRDQCPKCSSKTRSAHPAKFTLTDKYAKYRRVIKGSE